MTRLVLRSLGLLGIALLALVAVLLAVNAFDEDLSPEIVELLKPAAPDAREEDNGYYLLVGLDAPPGADPGAYGRQRVGKLIEEDRRLQKMTRAQRLREDNEAMQRVPARKGTREPDRTRVKRADSKYLCTYPGPCLEEVRKNRAQVKRILDDNRELLDRYRRLLQRPRLVAPYVPRGYRTQSESVGALTAFFSFQRLWITHVALEFAQGDSQAAFAGLERDIVLQRALLRDAASLAYKVQTIGLETDLALLAEMVVANPAAVRQFNAQIEAMLAPLTPDELSWTRLGKGESLAISALLEGAPESLFEWSLMPFFKRKATANRLYAADKVIYEWNEFSAAQHQATRERIAQANQQLRPPYWTFAYNPLGKLTLATG